jgi:hypothetical protein
MKRRLLLTLFCFISGFFFYSLQAQSPVNVTKTNSKPVFMHMMPWFDAPGTLGAGNWGWHWKMDNENPNIIVDASTGKRQIASHYYPSIGPYDSSDPDVIQYQLLLMKLSGIDGIMLDWYGSAGTNSDLSNLLRNSDSIINHTVETGIKFGLIYEDRFAGTVANATASMTYAKDHYFNKSSCFRYGTGNHPVVGVFGPITFSNGSDWTTILAGAGESVVFLPLEYQGSKGGSNTAGEYAWPYQSPGTTDYYSQVENFYKYQAPTLGTAMGVVYPGFNDFYAQGQIGGTTQFYIPENNGATLTGLFNLTKQYTNNIDILQLATWNDYGEGTMFEPTFENGYSYLVQVQQYTGVSYTQTDLEQVTRFYNLRKQYKGNAAVQTKLNQVFKYFAALQISNAMALMCTIDGVGSCGPSVTLASSGTPTEGGANGTFTITGSNLTGNTTVNYTIGGTAASSRYTASPVLSGSVQLTVAQPSASFTITAVDDNIAQMYQTLTLTLASSSSYTIVQGTGQLTIIDNDPLPCVAPVISFTSTAPVIDGVIEAAWAKAPTGAITHVTIGTLPSDFGNTRWRAMYDNSYLYVLVEVNDNYKYNDSGANWWDDDAVEVFLDGDNSKGTSYDGVNDYQIGFRYNDLTVHAGSGGINTTGISFTIASLPTGYTLEARIPWSAIGTTPAIGRAIGFDIAVDDDDNGGARDAQVAAFATTSTGYQNPSVFGTVYFTTCLDAPVINSSLSASGIMNSSFSYTISASNSPASYDAIGLPAGLSINTTTGVISGTPSSSGTSNVSISATNATGTDTETLSITISNVTSTLSSNSNANGMKLMPNPVTNGLITLQLEDVEGEANVEVKNAQGISVFTGMVNVNGNMASLTLEKLAAGLYFVQLQKDNRLFIQKFVVQ